MYQFERLPTFHFSDVYYDTPGRYLSLKDAGITIYCRNDRLSEQWQAEKAEDWNNSIDDGEPIQLFADLNTRDAIVQAVRGIDPNVTSLEELTYVTEIYTHWEHFATDGALVEFDYSTLDWDGDYWSDKTDRDARDKHCVGKN